MAESFIVSGNTKEEKYKSLIPQIKALIEGETDVIANLANCMSALKFGMNFFWVGIYFVRETSSAFQANSPKEKESGINSFGKKELVLGPFQGPVACTRIAYGKGVCGAAWKEKRTIIVEDVEKFPGHIACSSLSQSEIVVPAFNKKGEVALILDVDSEYLSNFDEIDKKYLEQVMSLIETFF